jgi:hypothetical protein
MVFVMVFKVLYVIAHIHVQKYVITGTCQCTHCGVRPAQFTLCTALKITTHSHDTATDTVLPMSGCDTS